MKKISLFILALIIINSLYILIPLGILQLKHSYFFGFSYLTLALFIIQSVLIFFYFFKNFSKKRFVTISSILLLANIVLAIIPFDVCDSELWNKASCDCVGIKKYDMFHSDCVGIRKKCYSY